ncbi:MAG TPA: rhomboid family intramembrane serine protease [Casimicrobiaceae bacterium]|nr:rhomboid family intramembrane serine protease [Casimicrobiaceae bacterium]
MLSFLTPWVKRLIVANVIVFAAQNFIPGLTDRLAFVPLFAFQQPWTIITYMFVHGGMWHIIFNMVTLGFFGPRVEAQLGGRRFLALYFISGLGGAVLSYFTTPAGIIGASGAIFGVELAFAIFWPHEKIFIWGVLPLEARWLVVLTTLYSLWAGLGTAGGGIAHFAHLGGYLGAFLYLRWIDFRSPLRAYQRKLETATFGKRGLGLVGDSEDIARWEAIPRDGLHPMNIEELDRVIAKAKKEGVRQLTPDERAFLHRMSLRGAATDDAPPVQ